MGTGLRLNVYRLGTIHSRKLSLKLSILSEQFNGDDFRPVVRGVFAKTDTKLAHTLL